MDQAGCSTTDLKEIPRCLPDGFIADRKGRCVSFLFTIGLMATGSLLILVTAQAVRILLECFRVKNIIIKGLIDLLNQYTFLKI